MRRANLQKSQALGKEKGLRVSLDFGVGELRVSPADPEVLYQYDLEYDESSVKPVVKYDSAVEPAQLHLKLESIRKLSLPDGESKSRLILRLTDRVPLEARVKSGVSESKIDLSGLQIQRLEVEGGVGETSLSFTRANPILCERILLRSGVGEFKVIGLGNANIRDLLFEGGVGSASLDLTGQWQRNAEIEMRLGIGEAILIAPRELGIDIERDKGLLSRMHLDGFEESDGRYRSRNYDKAKYRLHIRLKTGIGTMRVRWA